MSDHVGGAVSVTEYAESSHNEPYGSSSEGSLSASRSVVLRVECISDKQIKVQLVVRACAMSQHTDAQGTA